MKKTLWMLAGALTIALFSAGCSKSDSATEDPTPEGLEPLVLTLSFSGDGIFESRPELMLHAENLNSVATATEIKIGITTDLKAQVGDISQTIEVPANGTADFTLSYDADLDPGFYRARVTAYQKVLKTAVFGIRPFDIVSAPDKEADFDSFWETAKSQLPALDPEQIYLYEIAGKSNASCKVYFVELPSIPDSEGGEPVLIHGYYLEPQDGKAHPVIMHFYGYDTLGSTAKVACPAGNNGEFAEFYLSHRGQYLNRTSADKREPDGKGDFVNIYGDWFAYHFGNKDGYYYRGAFMDCVQAVNFMATRKTSDMGHLFAEGASQGGALSYACAALSDYPFTAIAPCVAFLGDFPDYFRIVTWPGDVAKREAKNAGLSDEEMYRFLSYFDTKNLATRIHCAVMACSGLVDGTCPPHTNIAPFNNLPVTDKIYCFYPEMAHTVPGDWNTKMMKFFRERIK